MCFKKQKMELSHVIFVRNPNARRYIIRVLPDQSIRVTIPKYGTESKAQKFLNENIEQLKSQISQDPNGLFELNTVYLSKYYQFKIIDSQQKNASSIQQRSVLIKIAEPYLEEDKTAEAYIHHILKQILRKEAQLYIPKRTMDLAHQLKLKVTDIKINSAKTRWGSCTGRNSINFSLYLMQLPKALIDYIILHELAHTIHKNHGPQFYELLDHWCKGEHKSLNEKVKTFSPHIKSEYFEKA